MKYCYIIGIIILFQQLVQAQVSNCYYFEDQICLIECPSGTYADPNKKCIKCPDVGCAICSPNNPLTCFACSGLYFLKEGKCVLQCISNEFKKVETNECLPCDYNICNKCLNSPTWCTECANQSSYLIQQSGQCLTSCDEQNGYNLTGGLCQKCQEGCLQCNSNMNCIKCQNGYYLRSGGVCVAKCETDYFCTDDINKLCVDLFKSSKCSGKNNSCKGLDSKECLKCPYFYDLKSDGTCLKGEFFEDQLTTQLLGQVNGKQCSEGCLKCTSQKRCQQCIQGYFLSSNKCLPCPQIKTGFSCLECFENPDIWQTNILSCQTFINTETQNTISLYYPLQYSINLTSSQAELMTCPISSLENCIKCDSSTNKCSICKNGYFLDSTSGKCNLCSDFISDCSSCAYETTFSKQNLICYQCSNGKIQNKDKQSCIFCEYGCESCQFYDIQQKKPYNYQLNHYQNPINGQYLSGWNQVVLKCLQCKSGYSWSGEFPFSTPQAPISNHQCIQQISNCMEYTWGAQGQMICLKCIQNYAIFLNSTTNQVSCKSINPDYSSSSISQCQTYFINSNNQLACLVCNPSYILSDDQLTCNINQSCNLILDNCSQCTSSRCLQCEQGYRLDFEGRGGCIPCSLSFCNSCYLSVDSTPSSKKGIEHPTILSNLNSLLVFKQQQLDQLSQNIVKKEVCTICANGYILNPNQTSCERNTNSLKIIDYSLFNQMKYGFIDKCNWYIDGKCISCKSGFKFNIQAQQCLINDLTVNSIGVKYERRMQLTWKYCSRNNIDDAASIFDKMIMKNQQEEYLYGEYGIQDIYVDITLDCSLTSSPSVIIATSVYQKWNVHVNILSNSQSSIDLIDFRLLKFKTINIKQANIKAQIVELGAIDNITLQSVTFLQQPSTPLSISISSLNQIILTDITLNNLNISFGDQLFHLRLFRSCTITNLAIKNSSFESTDILKIGSEDMNDEKNIFKNDSTVVDVIKLLMFQDTNNSLLDNPDLYNQPLFYQATLNKLDIEQTTFNTANIIVSYINHISIQLEDLKFIQNTLTDSILILCESLQASPNIFLSSSQLESINWFSKLTLINMMIKGNTYSISKDITENTIIKADQINIFLGEVSSNIFENFNFMSVSTGLTIQTFKIKQNTKQMNFIKSHIAQITTSSPVASNSSPNTQTSSIVSISKYISEVTLNELTLIDNLPMSSEYSFIEFNSVITFTIRGLTLTESTEKFFNQGTYIQTDSVNTMNIKAISITDYLPQQILSLNNVQSSCTIDTITSDHALFQAQNTASLIFIQSQQGSYSQSSSTPSISFSNTITFSNIQIKIQTNADGTFNDNRTNKKLIHIISFWKSNIVLTNIQFDNCGTLVIQADKSATQINSSSFKGNIQTIINSNKLQMTGNTFTLTHATQFLSSDVSIIKCDFNNNENIVVSITTEDSASIFCDTSNFTSNTSTQSGGALSIQSSSKRSVNSLQVTIINSTFNSNIASTQGGAIFSNIGGKWNIKKSSFSSNKALQSGGQALHLRSIDDSNSVKNAELNMQQVIIKAEKEASDTTKETRILESTSYISFQSQNSTITTAASSSSSTTFFWMIDIKDFLSIKQTYCSFNNYRELSGSQLLDNVNLFQDFSSDYINFMNQIPSMRIINSNQIELQYTNFKDSTLQGSENAYEFAGNQKITFNSVNANNIKCISNCKSLFTFYKNYQVIVKKGFFTNIYSNQNIFFFLGKEYSPYYPTSLNYIQVDFQQAEFRSNQVFSTLKFQNIRGSLSTNQVGSANKIVSILKCLFTKSQGMYGTGILSINSAIQVYQSEFSQNVAKQGGAGIFSMLGRFGIDSETIFKDNSAIFYIDYFNNEIYQIVVEYQNQQFQPGQLVLEDQAPGQQLTYLQFQLVDPALNPITMQFIRDYYNINIDISCSDTCELDTESMQIIESSYYIMFKDLKINGSIDQESKLILDCNLVRKYDEQKNSFVHKQFEFLIKFRECSPGEYLSKVNNTYSSCVQCQENSYSLHQNSKQCFTCPYLEEIDQFTTCQGDQISLPSQYWRNSNSTDKLVYCKSKQSNCLQNDKCQIGQQGGRCESCSYKDNYGRVDEYSCATYSNFTFQEQGAAILKMIALVGFILIFNLSLFYYQFTHIPKKVIIICQQFPGVKFKHVLNQSVFIPSLKILWFCIHIILLSFQFNLNISYISREVLQFFFLSIYQLQIYTEWILTLFHIFPLIPSYVMTIKLISQVLLLVIISYTTLYLTRIYISKKFTFRDSFIFNFFFHGFGIIIFLVNMIGCETISNGRYVIADVKLECHSIHHIIQFCFVAIPLLIFITYKFIKQLSQSKKEAVKNVRTVDYILNMEYPESYQAIKELAEDLKYKNSQGKRSPKVASINQDIKSVHQQPFDVENPMNKLQNIELQSDDKSSNQCDKLSNQNPDEQHLNNIDELCSRKDNPYESQCKLNVKSTMNRFIENDQNRKSNQVQEQIQDQIIEDKNEEQEECKQKAEEKATVQPVNWTNMRPVLTTAMLKGGDSTSSAQSVQKGIFIKEETLGELFTKKLKEQSYESVRFLFKVILYLLNSTMRDYNNARVLFSFALIIVYVVITQQRILIFKLFFIKNREKAFLMITLFLFFIALVKVDYVNQVALIALHQTVLYLYIGLHIVYFIVLQEYNLKPYEKNMSMIVKNTLIKKFRNKQDIIKQILLSIRGEKRNKTFNVNMEEFSNSTDESPFKVGQMNKLKSPNGLDLDEISVHTLKAQEMNAMAEKNLQNNIQEKKSRSIMKIKDKEETKKDKQNSTKLKKGKSITFNHVVSISNFPPIGEHDEKEDDFQVVSLSNIPQSNISPSQKPSDVELDVIPSETDSSFVVTYNRPPSKSITQLQHNSSQKNNKEQINQNNIDKADTNLDGQDCPEVGEFDARPQHVEIFHTDPIRFYPNNTNDSKNSHLKINYNPKINKADSKQESIQESIQENLSYFGSNLQIQKSSLQEISNNSEKKIKGDCFSNADVLNTEDGKSIQEQTPSIYNNSYVQLFSHTNFAQHNYQNSNAKLIKKGNSLNFNENEEDGDKQKKIHSNHELNDKPTTLNNNLINPIIPQNQNQINGQDTKLPKK